jgi:hypothetical protein
VTDSQFDQDFSRGLANSRGIADNAGAGSGLARSVTDAGRSCCPVCFAAGRSVPEHNLTECLSCGHVFQTDLNITARYDAAYAHQYDKFPSKAMSRVRWDFISSFLDLPVGSKILDVGYGNGAFLKHADAMGLDIYGIDVHSEDFGIPVVGFDHPLHYDLISFFDSLEHFADFAQIFKLRSRNVIISLPLTPDLLLTAPHRWRHFKPGEHIHYFSPHSLDLFMRRWGFSRRITQGFPEDALRGKLLIDDKELDNIYSAIYTNFQD